MAPKDPPKVRRRARRLVDATSAESPVSEVETIQSVANGSTVSHESQRRWHDAPGSTNDADEEILRLRVQVAELRTANEVLKTTVALLAEELDRLSARESAG